MYGAVLIALWGLLAMFAFGCVLMAGRAAPVPAQPDPFAAEVAQFMREVHDWDR